MSKLSYGQYGVVDGVLYRVTAVSRAGGWVVRSVDPLAEPSRREVPGGDPQFKYVRPTATYRGVILDDLEFLDDGRVVFIVWSYPYELEGKWPEGVTLKTVGNVARAGDGFWTGRIAWSELENFDDGIPDEFRAFLPADVERSR